MNKIMNNVQKINYGPLGADLRIIIDDDENGTQKVSRLNGQGAVDSCYRDL